MPPCSMLLGALNHVDMASESRSQQPLSLGHRMNQSVTHKLFQIFRAGARRQTKQGINTKSLSGLYQEVEGGPGEEQVPRGKMSHSGISDQKANWETSGMLCGGSMPH